MGKGLDYRGRVERGILSCISRYHAFDMRYGLLEHATDLRRRQGIADSMMARRYLLALHAQWRLA